MAGGHSTLSILQDLHSKLILVQSPEDLTEVIAELESTIRAEKAYANAGKSS
jgi:hypothetical protein